jgi:membrane protease YdiL (CAAX protease family)
MGLLGVAILLGYASKTLHGPAVIWLAALAVACWSYARSKTLPQGPMQITLRVASAIGVLALSGLLALHALPGFTSLVVAHQVVLSPGAAPYTFDLNFDKAVVGIFILGLIYQSMLREGRTWRKAFRRAAPIILVNVSIVAFGALLLGYSTWQPHGSSLFWVWATSNLFSTCLAEEGLFRAFILGELRSVLGGYRWGAAFAIAVSAVLFGLAHAAGGLSYVALATVAGMGYGLAFHRSNSVEMSMLAHLALNSIHFLLFTYPYALPQG